MRVELCNIDPCPWKLPAKYARDAPKHIWCPRHHSGSLGQLVVGNVSGRHKKKTISRSLALARQGRGPLCYMLMLCRSEANIGRWWRGQRRRTRTDNERKNQLYTKHLQQVLGLQGRRGRPYDMYYGCVTRAQIQDPTLMLGADGARMGLNKAHGTNLSPNPSGDMLGRVLCRRRGKRSRYNVNSSSLRTCNTMFVECLVVDACVNVASRVGRLLTHTQHMYINRIIRR